MGWELLGNNFTWDGVENCLGTPILGMGLGIAWEHFYLGCHGAGNCLGTPLLGMGLGIA